MGIVLVGAEVPAVVGEALVEGVVADGKRVGRRAGRPWRVDCSCLDNDSDDDDGEGMSEENADAADVLAGGGDAGEMLRVRSIGDSALRLLAGGNAGSGDVL